MVTLDNWYCEGIRGAAIDATALQLWAVEACQIGAGVARWCKILTSNPTVSPYASLAGSTIRASVIPNVNKYGALLQAHDSRVDLDIISDSDLYSVNRGTAVAGQTAFAMPSSAYGAYVKVVKNFAQLTLGTDYTVSGATVTLAAGITAPDSLFLVYPPAAAVRVEADYCKIDGTADRWSVIGVSYTAQSNVDTGSHLGFFWKGRTGNLTMINSTTVLGIQATKGSLRLSGAGTSDKAEINRPAFINLPTSATGLSGGAVWSDGGTLKVV